MHLVNDSPSFTPVHSQIRAIGPLNLHLAKGPGQQHYANIDVNAFMDAVELSTYFERYCFEANSSPGDSYCWGMRSSEMYIVDMTSRGILIDRLVRAQGQLGQALSRLANANR